VQYAVIAIVALVTGCYVEGGLGGNTRSGTIHGSVGLIAHFGDHGSVRAGGGGALGGYQAPADRDGSMRPGPIVVGGHARLFGDQDSLVATFHIHEPHFGAAYLRDPDSTEKALATRAYLAFGYRHSWREKIVDDGRADGPPRPREVGAITLALGPELFHANPTNPAAGSDTAFGAALSVMVTFRAWSLWESLDCMSRQSSDEC
jgi:hypothetical protein